MNGSEVLSLATQQPLGSYVNICYSSAPTLNAAAKREGITVRKITSKKVRFGCNYSHMKSTIAAKAAGRGTREMYERAIVPNILYENINSGQQYLRVGNVCNNGVSNRWLLNGVEVSLEEVKQYIVPSYFSSNSDGVEVQNVKVENVMSIGTV